MLLWKERYALGTRAVGVLSAFAIRLTIPCTTRRRSPQTHRLSSTAMHDLKGAESPAHIVC
jgi:hypothetical protein